MNSCRRKGLEIGIEHDNEMYEIIYFTHTVKKKKLDLKKLGLTVHA